jgi:hypothetical protein
MQALTSVSELRIRNKRMTGVAADTASLAVFIDVYRSKVGESDEYVKAARKAPPWLAS